MGSIDVFSEFTTLKSLDDYEIWQSMYPSDCMTIDLRLPPNIASWGAFEMHRTDLIVRGRETRTPQLRLNKAVLPSQGITFWWRSGAPARTPVVGDEASAYADATDPSAARVTG